MSLRVPIGVSGVAGSGKDLFFKLISKKMPVRRFALADKLKWETATWCYEHYQIDPLNCTREEKDKIRDFLVFHGTFKRKLSEGRHWINKLEPDIKGFLLNAVTDDIPVVTDIRYQEYEGDEVEWIKKELEGVLVHVSQYQKVPRYPDSQRHIEGNLASSDTVWAKVFLDPVNDEENREDPILKENADFFVEWEKIKCDNLLENEYLNQKAEEFVNWYNEKVKD